MGISWISHFTAHYHILPLSIHQFLPPQLSTKLTKLIFKYVSFPLSFYAQIGNLTTANGWKRFLRGRTSVLQVRFEPVSDFELVCAVCIHLCICNLITSCHFSNGHDFWWMRRPGACSPPSSHPLPSRVGATSTSCDNRCPVLWRAAIDKFSL